MAVFPLPGSQERHHWRGEPVGKGEHGVDDAQTVREKLRVSSDKERRLSYFSIPPIERSHIGTRALLDI